MKNIVKVVCGLLWLVILGYVVYLCYTDNDVACGFAQSFSTGVFLVNFYAIARHFVEKWQ